MTDDIYLIQSWEDSYNANLFLYEKMLRDGFVPEVILGVARGGWIPGRLLADFFKISWTSNIKVEFYKNIGETKEKPEITQKPNTNLEGKRIVVVDDVADTGKSLQVVSEFLEEQGIHDYKIATLFYKPQSAVVPDYYFKTTSKWVVFPWERFEFIDEYLKTHSEEDISSIRFKMKELGIPPGIIDNYFEVYINNNGK